MIMANRFQSLAPDILGSFERGQDRQRQADREHMADQQRQLQFQQQNAQYGQQQQLGTLELEERKNALKSNTAKVLMSVPPEARPNLYKQMLPSFRQAGIAAADEYTPELDTMMQAYASGGQKAQTPSNVQEWEHYNRLSPQDQQRYIEMKRSQQTFVPEIGGVRTVVRPGVAGGETTMQPLSTLDREAAAAQALSRAKRQGQANVDLATKPAIAGATTAAQESAKSAAERDALQRQNQTAYQVYQQARGSLQSAMEGTETGPIAGRLPAVTAAQQTAEGAQAAIAPVLKQLFRSSGEGVFTDKDQELLMAMVPTRTDHPEARNAKIQMIDQIVAAKLGQAGPSGSQQQRQTAPPPAAAQPQAGTPPVNARGWQLMIDAQGNRAYVSPDGAQFEEAR